MYYTRYLMKILAIYLIVIFDLFIIGSCIGFVDKILAVIFLSSDELALKPLYYFRMDILPNPAYWLLSLITPINY